MAETAFETALAGLYEASPPYADAEAFVAALTARLDRDARRRAWVVGGLGMAGAVVATAAVARSGLPGRLYAWIAGAPPEPTAVGMTTLAVALVLAAGALILAPVVVGSVAEA